jgi:phosphate transport system substrate-binding protein
MPDRALTRDHQEDPSVSISTPKRLGALAVIAAFALGACSNSGASTAPSAAATTSAPASAAPASDAPASAPASAAAVTCVAGSITAAGSTAMQPVVDAASKLYATACPGSTVNVQGGGSGTGLTQVAQGAIDIGNSDVTAEEKLTPEQAATLKDHVVLKQGWVQVVNASVTNVTNLTTQQSADIWTGKVTNWKDVGGPDQAIVLILRPASSGTRATFKKVVLGGADEAAGSALTEDSNGAVAKAIGTTPGSISVIGLAYYQANKAGVTPLQLDGVDASPATIADGTYKLSANGNMYTKGDATGLSQAFIDFMLGPQVQGTLIPSLFYAPAS